ncbi:tetratricopeptide repeat-containing protein [Azospirillum sp. B21]|uniref:tetratricopeptide repeat-containing protein n=1 Tax=Azospirillum sp. B21 TaxID=2607496 RepID=UPI00165FD573|nr:tetratricopeptide repeat-containing protein [Azospirillum sp. B21]
MVMPFGKKPTGEKQGAGPAEVNFNLLWDKALRPAIERLGYEAVRADEDLGPLIIEEMLERLTLADLVIADLTLSNANVYYEIGIRHGSKDTGCVLISADWSKQLFDVAQMRQVRYPLPEGEVTDEQAQLIIDMLCEQIPKLAHSQTPLYALQGYPNLDVKRTSAFRTFVQTLSRFQAEVSVARKMPAAARRDLVNRLLATYGKTDPIVPAIALELLLLVRDTLTFERTLQFVDGLPETVRNLPVVREQRALALSKTGRHLESIQELETLIALHGDSSERQGLLGGRYKELAKGTASDAERELYLDRAIEHYERGMLLDVNDYFPSSNLPRLLRTRNRPGDAERARAVNAVVMIACEGARLRNAATEWTNPTLLGTAFDVGDAVKAEQLLMLVLKDRPDEWKLGTTIPDLEHSAAQVDDADVRRRLEAVVGRLREHLQACGGAL